MGFSTTVDAVGGRRGLMLPCGETGQTGFFKPRYASLIALLATSFPAAAAPATNADTIKVTGSTRLTPLCDGAHTYI